jgi:hypothetical protein
MVTLLWVVGWIVCGILAIGVSSAYFDCKFPTVAEDRTDYGMYVLSLGLGPLALMPAMALSEMFKYGFHLPWDKKRRHANISKWYKVYVENCEGTPKLYPPTYDEFLAEEVNPELRNARWVRQYMEEMSIGDS